MSHENQTNSTVVATTLSALGVGQSAIIEGIDGDDETAVRLMEMGLIPMTEITLLGKAPLGDPWEISLRGYHLSIRKVDAARIKVLPSVHS